MNLDIHNRVSGSQRGLEVGDAVIVMRDDGSEMATTVRVRPFQIRAGMSNAGMWAIFVTGIAGYYALCRVRPRNPSCCD